MKRLIDRLLRQYDTSDWLLQRKARTLLALNVALIIIALIDSIVSSFLLGRLAPESFPNLIIVVALALDIVLLLRGRFLAAASMGIIVILVGITWTRIAITGSFSADPSYDFLQYLVDLILILFYANLIAHRQVILVATFVCSVLLLGVYAYALPVLFHHALSPATTSVVLNGFLFIALAGIITMFTFQQNQRAIEIAQHESQLSREAERKYREIFNSTSEAIFIHDAVTGELLDVNDAVVKMYGFGTKEEVFSYTIEDLSANTAPYAGADIRHHIFQARTFGSQMYEWHAKKITGELFWVEVSLHTSEIEGQGRILAVVRDITERRNAETLIHESEARFRTLVEWMPDAVAVYREMKVLYANPSAVALYGASSLESVIGTPIVNFIHPDSHALVLERNRNLVAEPTGRRMLAERHIKLDGTEMDIESQVTSIRYNGESAALAVIRDVTERKRAEDALQHERMLLRTIIDNIPDSIYLKDLACRKTLANRASLRNMGAASEADVLGKTDFEFYPREFAEAFFADDTSVMVTGTPVLNREDYLLNNKGLGRWVLSSKLPMRDKDGRIIGLVGIGRDITDRKMAEHALRESEELYRTFIEQSTDGLLLVDEKGFIRQWNLAMEQMTSIPRTEVIGRPWMEYMERSMVPERRTPERLSQFREAANTMLHTGDMPGGKKTFDAVFLTKDGKRLMVQQTLFAIPTPAGFRIGSINRDITLMKQAEASMQKNEMLHRLITENVPDVIWTIDLKTGRFTYISDSVKKLRGFSPAEAMEETLAETMTPESYMRVTSVVQKGYAERQPGDTSLYVRSLEIEQVCKDGSLVPVEIRATTVFNEHGHPIETIGISRDITERKRAEAALRESENRLKDAQRIALLGNWELNLLTNELLWSDEIYRIFEISTEKFGASYEAFLNAIHPEDRFAFNRAYTASIVNQIPFEIVHRLVMPDGRVKHVYNRCENMYTAAGLPLRSVGTMQDITELRNMQEQARRQQQQLIQSEKMASLGVLVSGIAHEINNPNNLVMFNGDLVTRLVFDLLPVLDEYYEAHPESLVSGLSYTETRSEMESLLRGITLGAQRIRDIVAGLKDFARTDGGMMNQKVDLNMVLKSSFLIVGNLVRKSTDAFSVAFAEDLPVPLGNVQQIEQVLINLITNACNALTDKSQPISIRTRYSRPDKRVQVIIEDGGAGISKEHMHRMFDPFFTTRRDKGGTGLGLSISYNIVQAHKGDLHITSIEGEGTTVTLSLPLPATNDII
jgi:hypothetical protein